MQLIKDHKFYAINFDSKNRFVEVVWKRSILILNIEEYKKVCLQAYEVFFDLMPQYLLQNTLQVVYPVTEELQNWLTENITKKIFIKIGLKKIAYLMPKDYLSRIGIELLIEKANLQSADIERKYFFDKNEAIKWLLSESQKNLKI